MKILLSPTKTFRKDCTPSQPVPLPFSRETGQLQAILQRLTPAEIQHRYKLSDHLTTQVHAYFQSFGDAPFLAGMLYHGEAFKEFDYPSLSLQARKAADEHLLIFSALYGLVNPLHTIRPYRLDLNVNISDYLKCNLVSFWRNPIQNHLKNETIIDLSSQEFSRLLPGNTKTLRIDFREIQHGNLKSNSMSAKQCRGKMARILCEQPVSSFNQIKHITIGDYRYSEQYSDTHQYLFIKEAI